jgi:hypothetical protein
VSAALCGGLTLRRPPAIPEPRYPTLAQSHLSPHPHQGRAGSSDLLWSNRMKQKQWDVTSMVRSEKMLIAILLAGINSTWLGLHTLVKQTILLEKPTWQGLQVASAQQLRENWAPRGHSLENVNLVNNLCELKAGGFPGELAEKLQAPADWLQPCETLWFRDASRPWETVTPLL